MYNVTYAILGDERARSIKIVNFNIEKDYTEKDIIERYPEVRFVGRLKITLAKSDFSKIILCVESFIFHRFICRNSASPLRRAAYWLEMPNSNCHCSLEILI